MKDSIVSCMIWPSGARPMGSWDLVGASVQAHAVLKVSIGASLQDSQTSRVAMQALNVQCVVPKGATSHPLILEIPSAWMGAQISTPWRRTVVVIGPILGVTRVLRTLLVNSASTTLMGRILREACGPPATLDTSTNMLGFTTPAQAARGARLMHTQHAALAVVVTPQRMRWCDEL